MDEWTHLVFCLSTDALVESEQKPLRSVWKRLET